MIFIKLFYLIGETLVRYNYPVCRFLLAIILLFLWYGLIYLKYIYKKPFTIDDYRIESKILTIFILITFFLGYLLSVLYLRIINTQKTVNIYKIVNWFLCNFKEASWFSIFSTACLVLTSVLIILFIINWYRKLILKYYFQLHFLIISYYPEYNKAPLSAFLYWHFDDEQPYESLKYLMDRWIVRCRSLISNSIILLPKTKIRTAIENWLYTYYKLYGLISMLLLFLYDVFFNEGNIQKVFYIMPFVFIYYLSCKYEEILFLYTFDQEECITTYLYFDIILSESSFVQFSNEKMISREELNNILENVIPFKHN